MTDEREQRDLDAEWEGLARFLAGESEPDEARRIRDTLERDAERAALVNALDAALTAPAEAPLSQREVEAALAAVMARRDQPADGSSTVESIPLRPRPTLRVAQLRARWQGAALRAAAAVLAVAGASVLWRATRADDRASTDGAVAVAPA